MNLSVIRRVAIATLGLLSAGAIGKGIFSSGIIPPSAAVVGRPATLGSIAGAARRTPQRPRPMLLRRLT